MNKLKLLPLLLSAGLASCQRTPDSPHAAATLAGSWRLTGYVCNCPPNTPVPDETVTFDNNQHFKYFRQQQLAAEGTYALSTGAACNTGPGTEPMLTLTPTAPNTYAPHGTYTLTASTLVIDQCSAADGPKYTFTRQGD